MAYQFTAQQFNSIKALDGISEKTMTAHYKLYQGYVNKTNELLEKLEQVDLSKANQIYSDLRALKVDFTFAVGGMKNHEIYFAHLGGKGGEPTGKLADLINRDFGSFEAWRTDMKQTGLAARGWVWLAYDHDWGCFSNYLGDAQNSFPVWNATPIVALDTYEHAYWLDYQSARAPYIDAFFKNLDWDVIQASFEKLKI
jgi:Fe-Mn family superoxide dismutase